MIIVKLHGGLGNQMFQYSFFLSLKNEYKSLDLTYYDHFPPNNNINIFDVFNLNIRNATNYPFNNKYYNHKRFIFRLKRKLGLINNYYLESRTHYISDEYLDEFLSKSNDIYLDGYWEDYRYFSKISNIIKSTFRFGQLNLDNKYFLSKSKNKEFVSIHFRFGDKLKSKVHLTLNNDYYNKAIKIILSKIENPFFLVFSDNFDIVETSIFMSLEYVFVDWNRGQESYRDMHLMSLCKHNIIANSTFSWWGAFLNNNPKKIVIAPKKRFMNRFSILENENYYPSDWTLL